MLYVSILYMSVEILRFIAILMILSPINVILTICRFMPLFWRFLEIKILHHILYIKKQLYTKSNFKPTIYLAIVTIANLD